MRPEHAVEGFRLLPHAQLGVLSGTDHMKVMTRAEWIVPMVGEFLDAPMQRTRRVSGEARGRREITTHHGNNAKDNETRY